MSRTRVPTACSRSTGAPNQTFSSLDAGQSITLNAATGTITAVLAGGLTTGTVTGNNVSTGDGSLATVVGNINQAGAGVTASAVQVGLNTYRLQLTSNTAGANNGENIDAAAFNDSVGGFLTLTAASDAQVTVGSGPGSYTVASSTNTVSGLLPGVTVNLLQQSTSPVTVTVAHDDAAIADKVQALIDAANQVQSTVDGLTKYDPSSNTASPLTGDATATQIMTALTNGFIGTVSGANPQSPGLAGVSIDGTGKFTFDRTKFLAAYDADPQGVTKLFAQGGSSDQREHPVRLGRRQGRRRKLRRQRHNSRRAGERYRAHRHVATGNPAHGEGAGRHDRGVIRRQGRRHPGRCRQRPEHGICERRLRVAGDEHRERHPDRDEPVRKLGELRRRLERKRLRHPRGNRHSGNDQRSGRDGKRATADGAVLGLHDERPRTQDREGGRPATSGTSPTRPGWRNACRRRSATLPIR